MNHMLYGCSSLEELDLHSFHTDNNLSIWMICFLNVYH